MGKNKNAEHYLIVITDIGCNMTGLDLKWYGNGWRWFRGVFEAVYVGRALARPTDLDEFPEPYQI
jgi:hypothetical protein